MIGKVADIILPGGNGGAGLVEEKEKEVKKTGNCREEKWRKRNNRRESDGLEKEIKEGEEREYN